VYWAGIFECIGAFIGYGFVCCVVMMCVFVVVFMCTWRLGDVSGGFQEHGCLYVYAGGLWVSCALVSVFWVCPGFWGETRLNWVVFCVWQDMSGVLVLWWYVHWFAGWMCVCGIIFGLVCKVCIVCCGLCPSDQDLCVCVEEVYACFCVFRIFYFAMYGEGL